MELGDLARMVPKFATASHTEKIKILAWFIHTQENKERFSQKDIRDCYAKLHYQVPANVTSFFQSLQKKKPSELLKDGNGYRLAGQVREALDGKYGTRQPTIDVDKLLAELPGKVSNEAERLFLSEAIQCFRIKAFRAAIVMTWNVAYDHFEEWILTNHLAAFNARIGVNYRSKAHVVITKKEDFGDNLKESEVIEIAKSAGLISDNIKKVMNDKLTRRNLAAHPSIIGIAQFQAEDAIWDLVTNVILKLT